MYIYKVMVLTTAVEQDLARFNEIQKWVMTGTPFNVSIHSKANITGIGELPY